MAAGDRCGRTATHGDGHCGMRIKPAICGRRDRRTALLSGMTEWEKSPAAFGQRECPHAEPMLTSIPRPMRSWPYRVQMSARPGGRRARRTSPRPRTCAASL